MLAVVRYKSTASREERVVEAPSSRPPRPPPQSPRKERSGRFKVAFETAIPKPYEAARSSWDKMLLDLESENYTVRGERARQKCTPQTGYDLDNLDHTDHIDYIV